MASVEIQNVEKHYGGFHALKDISLTIDEGEFIVMVGPSGCGKSTLLKTIAGLETVTAGRLRIKGRDVTHLEPGDRGIAMVVVTNKFESFASQILESLGLRDRFAGVIGGDTMGKGRSKPAPDPIFEAIRRGGGGSLAFVGDSSYDVKAARAANVPVIGARYGYCDKPRGELGADAEIDSLSELIPALVRLG